MLDAILLLPGACGGVGGGTCGALDHRLGTRRRLHHPALLPQPGLERHGTRRIRPSRVGRLLRRRRFPDTAHGKPKGTCCVSCKERVLPPAPVTIDHDEVGEFDFVSTAVLADAAFGLDPSAAALLARRDTGPPRAPAGRQALALHSTLVI
jgi:hypothetical protein